MPPLQPRWSSWLLGLFVAALLGACSHRTPVKAPTLAENPLPAAELPPYRLQVGDTLAVRFWGNPDLDEEVRVRPDGWISLPFIDEVRAAGLSPSELDAELTELYADELASPEITVIVRAAAGNSIYVGGEIANPGAIELDARMTAVQAIVRAGGLLSTARRRQVLLIRTLPDGARIARSIDLRPALSGASPELDPVLHPADVLLVPRTKVTNINLFVDQYINQILPIRPVVTVPLFDDPVFGDSGDS